VTFAAIIAQKGSDAWWYMSTEDLLPPQYRDQAAKYKKGTDTMDVWFDSGANRSCASCWTIDIERDMVKNIEDVKKSHYSV
jgi:isoleucyl-tRNA synthetase